MREPAAPPLSSEKTALSLLQLLFAKVRRSSEPKLTVHSQIPATVGLRPSVSQWAIIYSSVIHSSLDPTIFNFNF